MTLSLIFSILNMLGNNLFPTKEIFKIYINTFTIEAITGRMTLLKLFSRIIHNLSISYLYY